MYHLNFLKLGIAVPDLKVGNLSYNADQIIKMLNEANASVILFPELNLTSVHANDLFLNQEFLDNTLKEAEKIIKETTFKGFFTIGLPLLINDAVYNAILVINNKKVIGVEIKDALSEEEIRYFSNYIETVDYVSILGSDVSLERNIYQFEDIKIAFELGLDTINITPESDILALSGANIILNPSRTPEIVNEGSQKLQRVLENSRRQLSAYFFASPSPTESTSEFVYSGDMMGTVCGKLLDEASAFYDGIKYTEFDVDLTKIKHQRLINETYHSSDILEVVNFKLSKSKDYQFEFLDQKPFFEGKDHFDTCNVINNLLVQSLIKKISALPNGLQKVVIGVSGGADSTLALLIAEQALEIMELDPKSLIAVSMPSVNSSKESSARALELIDGVKATKHLIPIDEQLKVHLKSINHDEKDVTYENSQARIRTNILMDLANKHGGIVIGPSDLSEIALGFTTYSGDSASMYGLNSGIPKTVVLTMLEYLASEVYIDLSKVIYDISKTKPSPELLKNQVTEEIVGRYDINDFILYHFMKSGWGKKHFILALPQAFDITKDEASKYVNRFFKRFFSSQFKRNVLPEGPNLLGISLNPLTGFRLPGDNEVE